MKIVPMYACRIVPPEDFAAFGWVVSILLMWRFTASRF
jgi:hypothetical protein